MRVSYSRVSTFKQCPFKFKLKYIDELETYPKNDDAANPLYIGSALHKGIETNTFDAIKEYYSNYPIINDNHICEAIKLEYRIKQCKEILPNGLHEVQIEDGDNFVGFIDLLVPIDENTYDLYDFKYSNNVKNYMTSEQLHVYKYYFERLNPKKVIRDMYFLFVPKVSIRKKYKNKTNARDETEEEFRMRIQQELSKDKPQLVKIDYDIEKVKDFLRNSKECRMATKFEKAPTRLCDWCEYQNLCEKGDNFEIMNLPKNERRLVTQDAHKKIWLYGQPFSGKTYLANKFPNVLMLNTDGNIKYVDAPFIAIKDEVVVEGRITKRTLAWDLFKDTISELEKKQNDFETIVVDLLEDTYEYCRLYCYNKLGIEHESDNSFKAWDYVKTEFLSTIKRLMNMDYNIILISHEDTSKDLTKKSGDKVTSIKPNIQEKASLKIAGMVDIVGRVINDEGHRILSFKTNEVVFGGGRLNLKATEIPCDYDALCEVYHTIQEPKVETPKVARVSKEEPKVEVATQVEEPKMETPEEPVKRVRKARAVVEEAKEEAKEETPIVSENATVEEAPKRTRRRARPVSINVVDEEDLPF